MSYAITDDERRILDAILPHFELNEVIHINKCIRKSMDDETVKNIPVNSYAGKLKDFLVRYGFAKNLSGEAVIKAKGIGLKNAHSLMAFEKKLLMQHDFVVIDDDEISNILCRSLIQRVFPGVTVQAFLDPNAGLRHLFSTYIRPDTNSVIILLDINMPTLMGWDVLDEMKNFPDSIADQFKIFMLTSSINPKDKERAVNIPSLWGYLEKPLTENKLKTIFFKDDSYK